jgi:NTE family protein
MKALLEAGIKPDGLVGCSSGAFNAVALAAKPDLETVEQLAQVWGSIRNRDLFDRNPLRMAYRYVRTRNSVFDSAQGDLHHRQRPGCGSRLRRHSRPLQSLPDRR